MPSIIIRVRFNSCNRDNRLHAISVTGLLLQDQTFGNAQMVPSLFFDVSVAEAAPPMELLLRCEAGSTPATAGRVGIFELEAAANQISRVREFGAF